MGQQKQLRRIRARVACKMQMKSKNCQQKHKQKLKKSDSHHNRMGVEFMAWPRNDLHKYNC